MQEVRAEVEFIERHRNIAGYLNHHSSGGVVLRPSTTHDDSTIPAGDLRVLRVLAARALDETGYWLATSVYDWRWPPGTPDTKPGQTWRRPDGSLSNDPREAAGGPGGGFDGDEATAPTRPAGGDAETDHVVPPTEAEATHASPAYGGSIEFTYEMLGIISYASEQWRMAHDHDLSKDGVISDRDDGESAPGLAGRGDALREGRGRVHQGTGGAAARPPGRAHPSLVRRLTDSGVTRSQP